MTVFSIVMPVYNVAPYLNQAVQSIISQNFTSLEIILIDDGSTDGSVALCDDWSRKDARISVVHKNNQGLSAARNDGIKLAKGQYILFIDSDDAIVSNCLNEIYDIILKNPNAEVLIGKYIRCCNNGRKIYPSFCFDPNEFTDTYDCIEYLFGKIPESIWNVWRYIFKRNFILDNSLYFKEGIYCEDVEWLPRALLQAKNVFYYETPFYLYRYKRTGSIMQMSCLKKHLDLVDAVKSSLNVASRSDCNTDALKNALVKEYIAQFSFLFTVPKTDRRGFRECLKHNDSILDYGTSGYIRIFTFLYHFVGFATMSVIMTAARFIYHKIHE